MKLDKRLKAIMESVPYGAKVIDLGCDHGKIPVALALENRTTTIIATDISRMSLDKARKLAEKHVVMERIDFRCGDGLDVIVDGEADTLIIAGMGAREQIKILRRSKMKLNTYILMPHQETVRLRAYLSENNYKIVKDEKVKSGNKFYDLIVCETGDEELDYKSLMLGKSAKTLQDYREFLLKEKIKTDNLLKKKLIDSKAYNELKRYNSLLEEEIKGES